MLSTLFILFNIAVVFSCYSSYYDEEAPTKKVPTTTTTARVFSKEEDVMERNLPEAWGGFTPPPELKEVWRKWLDDYKAEIKLEETDKKYKHERGPNSGWPLSWKRINGGFAGAQPPPWAYQPINTGLPELCYLKPRKGSCDQNLKRWAFNPYTAECNEFIYSGCDENKNNFIERVKCEETCMKTPVSGCDPETQQYIMEDD